MTPIVPCPMLVGRSAEMATLTDALRAAADGRGNVVFVAGEAGIGKSRLVHEVTRAAVEHDAVVLRGRAVPGSGSSAFRPLTEALAAAVPATGLGGDADLEPWLPALAGVVPTAGPPTGGAETAAVRGEAVLRLLRAACRPCGVLVLEDLHWADPETMAVVEHLTDHLARAPVLCIATMRTDETSPARDVLRRVAARRTAEVIELRRLNPAQVAAMVHSCAADAGPRDIEQIAELSDGVPFLVEELLSSPGLPTSFAEGVDARLAELDDTGRRVLVTASAFGRHFDWHLLAAATGLDEQDVVDALERGVAAQLLTVDGDGFRFRHALTADAVFESVIPPRRQAYATSALAALETRHGSLPTELLDVSARLSERAGQRERAGNLYLAAGEDALARGALHTAVVALEKAVALLPAGERRDIASERLVDALTLAGRVDDALKVGDTLVARLAPSRAAAAHLRLAGAAATASRWGLAGSQLEDARQIIDAGAEPQLRAELSLNEAELALGTHDRPRAESSARTALAEARQNGLPEVECAALQLLGRCARRTSLAEAEGWFRRALAAADVHGLALWRLRALHEIGTIALLERSEVDELLEAHALAESLGAMATAAILDLEIASGYAGLDDLDGARRHALEAVRRGSELGLDLVVAHAWQRIAGLAAVEGDDDRAAEASAAARAAAPGNRDIDGLLVGADDLVAALRADDSGRALEAAQRCADLLRGSDTAPPMHFRALWPLLLAVDHRPEATDAIEELERGGVAVNRGARGALTMAQAIIAGWTDPERAAELALAADEQTAHMPWWRSVVRRFAAEAAAGDGWTIPEGWLAEAESCLRGSGFDAMADACSRLAGGGSAAIPPAWSRLGITRREADVLALVIEGHSNREVAECLYLSVRTVEKHVESLLRKTASRSRTQLARVATTT